GFSNSTGLLFHPAGELLLAQSISNAVLRLDPRTGQGSSFAAGQGLDIPIGLVLHPDGDLLVGSFGNDSVLRYDLESGELIGAFVAPGSGGLDGTHNLAFMPESNPASGQPIRSFATAEALSALIDHPDLDGDGRRDLLALQTDSGRVQARSS